MSEPVSMSAKYENAITLMASQNISMLEFATGRGILVPDAFTDLSHQLQDDPIAHHLDVIRLHNELSTLVAPARPHAIHLLMEQRPPWGYLFGELRVLGWMVLALVVSLLGFLTLAMNEHVTAETVDVRYLYLEGWTQFYVLAFIICAAALGSSVANLFKIYHYVTAAQFERRYEISYWVRFALGIASGLILAEMVPNSFGDDFTKPLIALLGGFAARVVEEILNRLIETLRTLVHGNMEARIRSQAATLETEYEKQRIREEGEKLKLLLKLKGELATAENADAAKSELDKLIETYINTRPIQRGSDIQ